MAQSISNLRVSISKRYGGKTVLDRLTLEIRGREFVTFLGPSGCGKSTALGIIAGLIPPTEGEIWNDDRRIDSIPSEKRGFGMVFQNYALFPHLTVFDNVAFGLSLQRRPADEIKRRVEEMLGLVRLSGYEDRYPSQLSGGQQQRVAVARAIAGEPSLLLADEPTGNLDSKSGESVMELLQQIHQNGATVCIVTHDPRYARHAQRSINLFDGRVVDVGVAAVV